jgi:uncharacterized phage protein (TIGR01671 family)
MREIKFRVWDVKLSKWISPTYDITSPFPTEDKIIEQFSGLTDKNGKDIYEGDIVVCFYDFAVENGQYIKKRDFALEEIQFVGGGFHTSIEDDMCINQWIDESNEIEVLGNIHENPELR